MGDFTYRNLVIKAENLYGKLGLIGRYISKSIPKIQNYFIFSPYSV